jgi:RNA polymerase sigma-70 factor (ECF subfamily)
MVSTMSNLAASQAVLIEEEHLAQSARESASTTPFPLAPEAAQRLIYAELGSVETRARLVASATRILGNPADAEDCVQEAMLQAARCAEQFAGRSTPYSWLYRVVLNACRMRRRSEQRDRRGGGAIHVSIDDLGANHPAASLATDPELASVGNETLDVLLDELSRIPSDDARLFRLAVLEDVPLKELAAEHRLTRQAVKSRLFRVRRRLAGRLASHDSSEDTDATWSDARAEATL